MIKRVLVFSNFGYETGAIGGQTIKVRHIYKLLDDKKNDEGYELSYFDTDRIKNYFLLPLIFFDFVRKVYNSTHIIFVGSRNNLIVFFPIIFFISKIIKKQIDYIVVGGWLADFLKSRPFYVKMLSNINGIYPQTSSLCKVLNVEFRLENVFHLDNFRYFQPSFLKKCLDDCDSKVRMVYMARVSKKKGVSTLFKLARKIERERVNAIIDVYGPIETSYQEEFDFLLNENISSIRYKGLVDPKDIYSVLSCYDLMLFPTRHYTEGFPGSILDAYISGIPVVVSKWKYAMEFVHPNETGLIAEFENDDDFIRKTIFLIEDYKLLGFLSKNAKKESEKYSPEIAWNVLKSNVFKRDSL